MPAKITIREITLKPEVDVEEFERYVKEEVSTFAWEHGISHRFAKYHSGTERSPYILIFEESEERENLPQEERDRLREERDKANPHNQVILEKLDEYIVNWREGERIITAYFFVD